jgi:pimeloyl-ACP methyl ester carboxylesterase
MSECPSSVKRRNARREQMFSVREHTMTARNITRRSIIGTGAVGAGLVALASGGAVSEARAQTAPKTFVLIHGAWMGGWYWRRVSDLLEKKGHKVFSPTLTGLGERSHLLSKDINLDTHVTDIVNVIKWESLNDICFVAHSYAGFPASGALDQIGDRVSSIVWLDALKPENGDSVANMQPEARRAPLLAAVEKGEAGLKPPKAEFLLVNEKDRALVDEKATPHPTGTLVQPIKLSGGREKVAKKTYIRATRFANPGFDKALERATNHGPWLKRMFLATP